MIKQVGFGTSSIQPRTRWLLLVLGLGFIVYFLLLIPAFIDSSRLFVATDTTCYEELALNILGGRGYCLSSVTPNSTIVPLYPLFITGIYAVVGRAPYVVVAIQIILSLGIVAFIIHWGLGRFSTKVGILAGLFLLLELCLGFYSVQLMAEVLFLTLLVPGLWFVKRLFDERSSLTSGFIAGVFFGLAALTRPIGLYFPLLIPFLFLTRSPTKSRLLGYVVLLLCHIAIVSPWFIRNRLVFGHFFFSTVQSVNLIYQHAAPVKAVSEGKTIEEAVVDLQQKAFQRYGEPRSEAERFLFPGREALRYIARHPLRYAGIYLAGVLKTLLPLGLAEFHRFYTNPKVRLLCLGPSIHEALLKGEFGKCIKMVWDERVIPTGGLFFIYVAAALFKLFLIGLALRGFLIKGFRSPFNFLAFLVGIYFIGVTGPAGQPRHFLPLLPLAALLAAHALVSGMAPTEVKA
jgi:4-amino-4-deoxy-L-arabinose transferase-like glycosyltransferase